MAGKGGKRPGAGRKPSTLKGVLRKLPSDTAALILQEINANQKWVDLANSKKEAIVLETLKYLTDRAYGKPRQAVEMTDDRKALDFGSLPTPTGDFRATGKPN